ncbi:adenylate/guanylate cyclase domain-containing protein [Sinorhizobium fredii]|uniref:adenylate/guanylate cyclase domain-containing protein n=1 Tax=Rhizobium fredii TaxID=380 RepID=UPI0018659E58|nr:adenylate/guanylate cyclase domain-containing protein [Sinorhizobium fredii]
MVSIRAWLLGLGLGQYERAFCDNDIDASLLPTLTDGDLRELGVVSLGHRKQLLAAIAELHRPASGPSAVASAMGQAERRQLTIMFVDLVGSTALSSRLDPEDMRQVLRAYQNAVMGEIARGGGHLAKLMGDGVLAYFGWPRANEDDAERAVQAGLTIVQAVKQLSTPFGEPLAARVGIATGLVIVGDLIGDGAAREEAVVGETPNLAARLQEVASCGTVVIAAGTAGFWATRSICAISDRSGSKGLISPSAVLWFFARTCRRAGSRPGNPAARRPWSGAIRNWLSS